MQLTGVIACQICPRATHFMKSEPDGKVLVEAVLSKDRAAFEKLIRQYEGLVIHIVVPMIKNQHDREDICQDVFLKVFEKLDTFQFRSNLSTWIGNIAYNTSINFLKKRKNILLEDIINSTADNDLAAYKSFMNKNEIQTPERILILKEDSQLLNEAIAKLPAIQKTILLLFHKQELTLDEISGIIEMPVNTVKSHLFRARINLKEILLQHKN